MNCWICGAEPFEVFETTRLCDPEPTYMPGRWPPGDHPHAEYPPTPAELEQAGHDTLMRILAQR